MSLFSTALAMCPYVAHLMTLPNKISLGQQDYFDAQQVYTGWAYSAVIILISLLSTICLAIIIKDYTTAFRLALAAVFCIGISLMIFYMFTFPANQLTDNWTHQLESWETLRFNWEYSHAVNALIYMIAEMLLIFAVLSVNQATQRNRLNRPAKKTLFFHTGLKADID